jgi:hypothetical protein
VDGELEVVTVSVGTVGFNCRRKVLEMLPEVAFSVAVSLVPTEAAVAVKPALVAFAETVTVAGRVTAALLLDRLTAHPVPGAGPLKVTVQ